MLEVHLPDISHGHSISDDDAEALELGFLKAALEIATQIRAACEAAACDSGQVVAHTVPASMAEIIDLYCIFKNLKIYGGGM